MRPGSAFTAAILVVFLAAFGPVWASEDLPRTTVGPDGIPILQIQDGNVTAVAPTPERSVARAGSTNCPPAGQLGDIVYRDSSSPAGSIDACGTLTRPDAPRRAPTVRLDGSGSAAQEAPSPLATIDPGMESDTTTAAPTIDRMTTYSGYYSDYHNPGSPIVLMASADTYFMSDGTSWQTGAGSYSIKYSSLDHVEVDGDTVRYILRSPPDGLLYQQTDYDFGNYSAQGQLGVEGPLVLEATIGSTTAVMHGTTRVVSNDATWYGDRFRFYSAIPGSVVPFDLTCTLFSGTWTTDMFDRGFYYRTTGLVDFAHPVSVPAVVSLEIRGSAQVPENSSVAYTATAVFTGGIERDVTANAGWEARPADLASIAGGVLSIGALVQDPQPIVIRASYTWAGTTVENEKTVLARRVGAPADPDSWPMFQANARHTGYIPERFEPEEFVLRWERAIAPGRGLNPVAAADGRVFASIVTYFNDVPALFALDGWDGETLWSKSFGSVFSVNPPSVGYGNVYVQTGDHASDTWLHAFDAETGERVFRSPHAAQWERYFAPTILDGLVYIDGGYYGGMYAFDAFSGAQKWFVGLPQYDEWTPGVFGDYAYAYVGSYRPGLYVSDRHTGESRVVIDDPHFSWNGWSMNLAPVVLENGDVIAIHDGRLIRFDVGGRQIAWELRRSFQGQPSVANGVIYAVDGGQLVALDETSGATLWSWAPPEGSISGPMIVTDSHVFASTGARTYAVELLSHDQAWTYPAAGSLAIGNETLYIAGANGTLTAIAAPAAVPVAPVSMELSGPDQVVEFSSGQFTARVTYDNGRVRDRTHSSEWTVEPGTYAGIDRNGVLSVGEMLDLGQDVVIRARYTENGVTVDSVKNVHLLASVTLEQFVERNRLQSLALQQEILQRLEISLAREKAILRALGTPPIGQVYQPDPYRILIGRAIESDLAARASTQQAIEHLEAAGQTPLPTGSTP